MVILSLSQGTKQRLPFSAEIRLWFSIRVKATGTKSLFISKCQMINERMEGVPQYLPVSTNGIRILKISLWSLHPFPAAMWVLSKYLKSTMSLSTVH